MPSERSSAEQTAGEDDALFDEFVRLPYNPLSSAKSPPGSPSRKRSHDDMNHVDETNKPVRAGSQEKRDEDAASRVPASAQTGMTQPMATASITGAQPEGYQSDPEPDEDQERLSQEGSQTSDSAGAGISGESEPEPEPEPGSAVDDFDWTELEHSYHRQINELNGEEHELWEEFQDLCSFFASWADTMQTYEVDRSYKRLKTQMTYVQREEENLEQKRRKYVQVVEAFQSALELLK